MNEFQVGDRVRLRETELEGAEGTVLDTGSTLRVVWDQDTLPEARPDWYRAENMLSADRFELVGTASPFEVGDRVALNYYDEGEPEATGTIATVIPDYAGELAYEIEWDESWISYLVEEKKGWSTAKQARADWRGPWSHEGWKQQLRLLEDEWADEEFDPELEAALRGELI